MSNEMVLWRRIVVAQVAVLADEAGQRKSWFCLGPWNSCPKDEIALFLDYTAAADFVASPDNGLSDAQSATLKKLSGMMGRLRESAADTLQDNTMIDDPRWRAIQRQAKATLRTLTKAG